MHRLLKLAHLFAFALLAGFMAVVQWSLVPAQNRLDGPGYATLEKGMNQVLETLTPALMITALAAGIALLLPAWKRASPQRAFYATSVLCLAAMIVSTLLINAPVNAAIDRWLVGAPPTDWTALRGRWELGHAIRSYVGLIGLAAALVGVIWENPPDGRRFRP